MDEHTSEYRCPFCRRVVAKSSRGYPEETIIPHNGLAIEVITSKGGWGRSNSLINFNDGEVCETCFEKAGNAINTFKNSLSEVGDNYTAPTKPVKINRPYMDNGLEGFPKVLAYIMLFMFILMLVCGCTLRTPEERKIIREPVNVKQVNKSMYEIEYDGCLYVQFIGHTSSLTHKGNCTNHRSQK